MPLCPGCRAFYLPHVVHCEVCDRPLEPDAPAPAAEWVVAVSGGPGQVLAARAALESAGIETLASDDFLATTFARVLVPSREADRARAILAGLSRLKSGPAGA